MLVSHFTRLCETKWRFSKMLRRVLGIEQKLAFFWIRIFIFDEKQNNTLAYKQVNCAATMWIALKRPTMEESLWRLIP